ncbi:MAG TPA: hypothetical protein VH760_08180 [Gaiellaceae bacterium]|jgi:hypothetical protein
MARKRKKPTEAQIRALNGGDEAYERHERVQQQLLAAAAYLRARAQDRRQAEQAT